MRRPRAPPKLQVCTPKKIDSPRKNSINSAYDNTIYYITRRTSNTPASRWRERKSFVMRVMVARFVGLEPA